MKDTLKILCFNKGAIIDHYLQNPNEMYAPTHIFPLIDPAPEHAHSEYKTWATEDKLYKDHWRCPYMIGQLEQQDHIHFPDGDNHKKFQGLLNKEVEIQHCDNADDVKNIGNIIAEAKDQYNNVIVIVHRLHSYCIPLFMWKAIHQSGINIVIDNAFEAESYSLHRLFYWLHTMFDKATFVKYLYSAHDISFNEPNISRANLIKQEFGIELVSVEFFMLHELQGNKSGADNEERNPLIYKHFDPANMYKDNKPYKFLCLNNYMKDHRLYIVNEFVKKGLLDKGIVSARFSLDPNKPFYNHGVTHFGTIDSINEIFGQQFDSAMTEQEYTNLQKALPIIIDDDLIDNQHAVNSDMFNSTETSYEFRDRWVNWEWYTNTEFTIVNESSFTPDLISQPGIFSQYITNYSQTVMFQESPNDVGFLTEKTFKPIMYGHPFIIASHPGALARLKQLGFETFPQWFDEGYDDIGNSGERIRYVSRTIEKACNNELHIDAIKAQLEHNRNHFFNVDTAVNLFNNLFDDLTRRDK